MTSLRTSAMRHAVAAVLMLVLTLAGVERGLAVSSDISAAVPSIPGVVAPICHSGGEASGNPTDPGAPVHHDCCDQCTVGAPVVLPGSPGLPLVLSNAHPIVRSALIAWTLRLSRARSPRQSQGPPSA